MKPVCLFILKCIFLPIYFLIDVFWQIDVEYQKYIYLTYANTNDLNDDYEKNHNSLTFIMPRKFHDLIEIKLNHEIFIKQYDISKYNQIINQIDNSNDISYDLYDYDESDSIIYIVSLRNNTLYSKLFNWWNSDFIPSDFNEFMEKNIFDSKINNYAIYKFNPTTNFIQVHLIPFESYKIIKKKLLQNYILISNILALNNKYAEITDDNYNYEYEKLFTRWIEPIEPSDVNNYKKILKLKINEEQITIDNNVYTDVLCFRNFIQIDYSNEYNSTYSDESLKMPMLYTTYRIDKHGNILTILH